MSDLTQVNSVIELMKSSKSEQEWNDNCDKVKVANNGYPEFWFKAIILSGVASETQKNWILSK